MGWVWIVKAWVKNPEYSEAGFGKPEYHYQTVYEGNEEQAAITAWKKAKADGAGCVIIEDRS